MQERESLSINSSDTSFSRSNQLESALPQSKISALSSGEFVGMVADDPDCKIELKAFLCENLNDHEALKKEEWSFKEIPVFRKPDNSIVQRNYLQIKQDVRDIIDAEVERMLNDPGLGHLVVKKQCTLNADNAVSSFPIDRNRALSYKRSEYRLSLAVE